jgi:hypothetical protein
MSRRRTETGENGRLNAAAEIPSGTRVHVLLSVSLTSLTRRMMAEEGKWKGWQSGETDTSTFFLFLRFL